jgi:hypothetical protein
MPPGFQIMIRIIAAPKSSIRYSAKVAPEFGQQHQHQRGEDDAELAAHAAEHDDREDDRRLVEGEGFRRDEALPGGEEDAGEAAEHGADGKGRELDVARVDAHRLAGDLVLAHRFPGAADRQLAHPRDEQVGEQRQRRESGSRER